MIAADCAGGIYTSSDFGITWATGLSVSGWVSVASTGDGTGLFALADSGARYLSADSGATWTADGSDISWTSVASSADGSRLVAAADGNRVYTLQ